ncbi:hypothetical protein D6817_00770 [Candidatus Pacearchaeota archaeon]|nr:MAG: hypothetical protein D6817_00770 [Candidatus Pacearchaeota archaeon]
MMRKSLSLAERFISRSFLQRIPSLRRRFELAKPYPHLHARNFLDERVARELAKEVKGLRFERKETDLFSFYQSDDFSALKSGELREFYEFLRSEEGFAIFEALTGAKLQGQLRVAATLFKPTDYLLCHDDNVESRKLAFIIYLTKGMLARDGGRFVVYNSKNLRPTDAAKKYSPTWNSLLVFKVTRKSFHEVEENVGKKSRYAIGGWLN